MNFFGVKPWWSMYTRLTPWQIGHSRYFQKSLRATFLSWACKDRQIFLNHLHTCHLPGAGLAAIHTLMPTFRSTYKPAKSAPVQVNCVAPLHVNDVARVQVTCVVAKWRPTNKLQLTACKLRLYKFFIAHIQHFFYCCNYLILGV